MGKQIEAREWTGFQEIASYGPRYDLRCDFVMVYGIDEQLPERIAAWRERGYAVHLMTGVAWGQYQDYLDGKFDGRRHWDEAQTTRSGKPILHGDSTDVPYMVPTIAYSEYLAAGIKKAVDCGIEAIHLEEPEFWVEAGYSEAFQREWRIYYGEPWIPPHSSPDAQYRAAKLKAYLNWRALDRLCSQMNEYAAVKHHRILRFYVPTHSLVNYTQWLIVSPESKLIDLPTCDGFIGQVWTGTARTPNVYRGVRADRTFETAFLEYGSLQELVRGTGREMWFLHDPVEDDPGHTWADYRSNYYCTVVASLFHPEVSKYEISPWPRRVFEGRYPKEDGTGIEGIPVNYATELLTVMNALRDMHNHPAVFQGATTGVGLLLADSAMYQRGEFHPDLDASIYKYDGTTASQVVPPEKLRDLLDWSAFYGLALPLVKHGVPLRPVQLDNIQLFPGYLDEYRVLLLSYEFMKPEHPGIHQVLVQWVQAGGVLVYMGDGSDPFHHVREWWNQGRRRYATADAHLFEALGLGETPVVGEYRVGRGGVIVCRVNPACLSRDTAGAAAVRAAVRQALVMRGEEGSWIERHNFQLRRGPYVISSVLRESVCAEPLIIQGHFIDLFDAELPVCKDKVLLPGENSLLFDLARLRTTSPHVVVSSSRIIGEESTRNCLSFFSEAPSGIAVSTRVFLPATCLSVTDEAGTAIEHIRDTASHTLLLKYRGNPHGTRVSITW